MRDWIPAFAGMTMGAAGYSYLRASMGLSREAFQAG